jgi:hypothetical protein
MNCESEIIFCPASRSDCGILIFRKFKASWILGNNYLFFAKERTAVAVLNNARCERVCRNILTQTVKGKQTSKQPLNLKTN